MAPSLRWGRVAAAHPEDYSVDLVMTDTGERIVGVHVLSPSASTNTGYNNLPSPATPASGNPWDLTATTSRDVLAGVAYFGPYPVVLGFRFPQICQMLFAELDRAINRHASDFYTSIDGKGNFEAYHPSGTYFRVGTSPAHEDLTGKDFDGQWKIANNTASAPYVHLTVANAGAPVASVDIDPSGNVTLQNNGNLTATVSGNLVADVQGFISNTSQSIIDLNAPTVNAQNALTVGNGASGTVIDVNGKVVTFQAGICTDIS